MSYQNFGDAGQFQAGQPDNATGQVGGQPAGMNESAQSGMDVQGSFGTGNTGDQSSSSGGDGKTTLW